MHENEIKELMGDETFATDQEFVEGGFTIIDRTDGGMVAHRGVVAPDVYVDPFVLRQAAEAQLGFTYAEVSAAYKNGRPSVEQRQLRERIDTRLLALSRSGTNLVRLADVFGLNEKTLDRALSRARDAYIAPIVKRPAVTHALGCFKCGEPARRRKRRFSTSPKEWVGTVALCDDCYAAGFTVTTTSGGPRAVKRRVSTVGLIQDKDTRTFGGHRHYGPPWVPVRERATA